MRLRCELNRDRYNHHSFLYQVDVPSLVCWLTVFRLSSRQMEPKAFHYIAMIIKVRTNKHNSHLVNFCSPNSFIFHSYEPSLLCLSYHINAKPFFGFCLQVFLQAGPPQIVDCLAPIEICVRYLFRGHNDGKFA